MKLKETLTTTSKSISKIAGRTSLKIQKHSPEILLGAGIIGFVGTVALACKATLSAEDIIHSRKKQIAEIHSVKESADSGVVDKDGSIVEYDDDLYKHDLRVQYAKMALEVGKSYAPTIAVGTLSLACILTSRNIMQKRYLGAVAAYNAVSTAFNEYRERVRAEAGEIMDRHYRYGTELETIETTVTDENGKKKKVKEIKEKANTAKISTDGTERFFDDNNKQWEGNPEYSLMFLRGQQNYLNDLLHTRGHVFLNEVYEALGFDHTQIGAVVGWVMGFGDGFIDFGLDNYENSKEFVNGESNNILLTFNHDGTIWDKI